MSISSRIHDTLEQWSKEWKDRIKGWLLDTRLAEIDKELAITSLDPNKFRTKEVKELVEQMKASLVCSPKGLADWIQTIMGDFMTKIWDIALGIILPSKMETFEEAKAAATWLSSLIADFILLSATLDIVGTAMSATLIRNLIHIFQLFASTFGLDRYFSATIAPAMATSIIPRLSQGYNAQYQTAIPQINELILMAVKEAFTPEIAEKFGQYENYPEAITEWLEKQGLSKEWSERYWAAHWNLPGTGQGFDLMHRGLISEEELKILLRALDVMPFWRDKLVGLSWDLPNRIELRMMARYGLVDKQFLLDILKKIGLHQDYRSIAADMMIVMGIQSDLSARYAKGWIKAEDIKAELAAASLDPKIQTRVYQWIVKQSATERVAKEKDLTVADIIKGVKKGTISRAEGQTLLEQLGYDATEAKFKLDINIPEEETTTEVKQRELTKSDILNSYKLGQIDEAEAVSRLISIRYSEDDAIFLITLTIATIEKIAEVKERDLTKADIIKGVKTGVISQEEGYYMLLNIGYSSDESMFLFSISATATAGSPSTYNEFLAKTQGYRASQGQSTKEVSPDIIQAERDVKAAEAGLRIAKNAKASEKRLQELTLAFEQAKQRYHQLTIAKQKPKT